MSEQVSENIFKINKTPVGRLSEMGFIKGTIFRIVKKVAGMFQIRFDGNDIVIREETIKEIEVDEIL